MVGPTGYALVAMLTTLGVLVVVTGAKGLVPDLSGSGRRLEIDHVSARLGLCVLGSMVAYLVTSWPVAAFYCGLGGLFLPTMALAKKKRRESIERIEAIAVWAESLRDIMAASAGIQEAIKTSARVAPAPIRREVQDLTLRLQHQSVGQALRRFAADMANPLSDMVVASLVLATGRRAGSLESVLAMTAKGARDSAAMSRQIEVGRTRMYAQARMAGWVSFSVILLVILTRRDFLVPFDTVGGQVVLFLICGIFFGSAFSIYWLSRPVDGRRLFQGIETWSDNSSPQRLGTEGSGQSETRTS